MAQPRQFTEKSGIVAFWTASGRCCKGPSPKAHDSDQKGVGADVPGAWGLACARQGARAKGVLIVFTAEGLRLGEASRAALGSARDLLTRLGRAERFTGKSGSSLDIVAPAGLKVSRLIFIGTGKDAPKPNEFVKLGGMAKGKIRASATEATILADLPGGPMTPDQAADLALGATLRAYAFDRYKTKRKEGEDEPVRARITVAVADLGATRRAWQAREAVGEG